MKKGQAQLENQKKKLKKRKKDLKKIGDNSVFKKVNADLKREYRANKRVERQTNDKFIKE